MESVGHIQTQLVSALCKLKSNQGNSKLSDGKTIRGYGRLTADRDDKLQTFYGLAIRRHKDDLTGMEKEASTDAKPQHRFCPKA